MVNKEMLRRVAAIISAAATHPSQLPTDTCYGPEAKKLRAQIASIIHGRPITSSAKESQWNNFRDALTTLTGAQGDCIATREHEINRILRESM